MALSSGEEVQTAVVSTQAVSGASTKVETDAHEDREILGLQVVFRGAGANETYNGEMRVYLGADEIVFDGSNDSTQILAYAQSSRAADTTNGVGTTATYGDGFYDFGGNPFEWNEHQTLSLRLAESSANGDIAATILVYYREV